MALTEKEIEFQRLLDELDKLIIDRDAALLSLSQVDEHLAALSTAIGLTCAGLNTPTGLLCMLRPVSHLADVLGSGRSSSNFLFELTLRNDSILSLSENWNITVARLKPQENSVVHVASLPRIAAGSAWTGTMALDLPSSSSSASHTKDSVDLAVFLSFNGPITANTSLDNVSHLHRSSNIALLHVFQIDSLHLLQACGQAGGGGGSVTSYASSYQCTSSQSMGIKLGIPKQFFGLEPEPKLVLDLLLKQGERSLPLALKKQISNEMKERNFEVVGSGVGNNNGIVGGQRKQQKFVVQGELPVNYTAQNTTSTSASTSVSAVVGIQPAPFSLAAASSPHAILDLTCETGNLVDCLRLHKAALRRIQLLQTAVQENNNGCGADGATSGIQLSHGVVVPPACSFGAIINRSEIDEINSKLSSLKESAERLKNNILAAEAQGEVQRDGAGGADEENRAAELLELVKSIRNLTKNLFVTL